MVAVEVATSADVDHVADLWVELARDQRTYGSHLLADENRAAVRETVARYVVDGTVYVARDEGVVGFVSFEIQTGAYEQGATRGIVQNVYVSPEYRDEGVGSALLDAAEEELEARGADVVALEVLAENEAARRMYERRGYEPHRIELEKSVENDNHSKE